MTRIGGGGFRPIGIPPEAPSRAPERQTATPSAASLSASAASQAPVSLPEGGSITHAFSGGAPTLSGPATASAVQSRGAPVPQGLRTPPAALDDRQIKIAGAIAERGGPVPAGLRSA